MVPKYVICAAILAFVTLSSATSCKSPSVTGSSSFTTVDGTIVSQVAYIAEFELKCSNSEAVPLFAEYAGRIAPVAKIASDKYQVS